MSDEQDRIVRLQERMDAAWLEGLAHTPKGAIIADERNVMQALRTAPELRGLLQFNEFGLEIEFTKSPPWRRVEPSEPWTDEDGTALLAWLQAQRIPYRGRQGVADCVAAVSRDRKVHPVRQYLAALEWDGTSRIGEWLRTYLRAEGNRDYLDAIGQCWLRSAVARIWKPGCKADHVIVLEAKQGTLKSTLAATLARNPEWFADSIGDVHNKDAAIQLRGRWIIELAELAALSRPQIEAVKAYLSRTQDVYRPPYGRSAIRVPRQTVFIGTTNEAQYLRDKTGNRRYWPVRCGKVDIESLEQDLDQLWAEAYVSYKNGEKWWLTGGDEHRATLEQDQRRLDTEIEAEVTEYVETQVKAGYTHVTTRQIFQNALSILPGSENYATKTTQLGPAVAAALQRAGCVLEGRKGTGSNRRRVYRMPPGPNPSDVERPVPDEEKF